MEQVHYQLWQDDLFDDDIDHQWSALSLDQQQQALSLVSELLLQIVRHRSSSQNHGEQLCPQKSLPNT